MGKIIVSENLSLDGVVQDPTGEEGLSVGGWFGRVTDADREAFAGLKFAEALGTEALLLGARSYRWFTARWANRPGEWADRLRSLPKYVVTSGPDAHGWGATTVLGGDVVKEVAALKEQVAGDIVVYASAQLAQTLLEHDLVEEFRLTVYPVALGAGRRLFGETSTGKPLRLTDSRRLGDSLLQLTYETARTPGRP